MDTERYCSNLDNLDKTQAIRAIHEAYLQLKVIGDIVEDYERIIDNKPVLENLKKCLESAGHLGFIN